VDDILQSNLIFLKDLDIEPKYIFLRLRVLLLIQYLIVVLPE